MKKVLTLLILIFLLISCGSNEEQVEEEKIKNELQEKTAGLRFFPGEDFNIRFPAAWNEITNNKEAIPTPTNGDVELAVTSSETKNGFANNLIILSQELKSYVTSKEYSMINNIGAENKYLNYYKKSGKEFIFDDGEKSMIYIFQAKYSEETPVLIYIQTAYICNTNKAFFITIALPLDITDTNKYEEMMKTFECK